MKGWNDQHHEKVQSIKFFKNIKCVNFCGICCNVEPLKGQMLKCQICERSKVVMSNLWNVKRWKTVKMSNVVMSNPKSRRISKLYKFYITRLYI